MCLPTVYVHKSVIATVAVNLSPRASIQSTLIQRSSERQPAPRRRVRDRRARGPDGCGKFNNGASRGTCARRAQAARGHHSTYSHHAADGSTCAHNKSKARQIDSLGARGCRCSGFRGRPITAPASSSPEALRIKNLEDWPARSHLRRCAPGREVGLRRFIHDVPPLLCRAAVSTNLFCRSRQCGGSCIHWA
ncbi:hypothetical protein FA95DRAFT_518078 [Auriscalpium vulgare]|uniref:Uncharacterized protein n=1 Tax=Auriscalpium vulgare TaxID=40419 RepID=A0ACB8S2N7_9AGAM|nr:hypothetical protein FA95DRAFT_518078 [Auriscalpium vulgare]